MPVLTQSNAVPSFQRTALHLKSRERHIRAALWLSTILCSGLSAPALAQNVPPPFRQMDDNGVDILNGTVRIVGPSISIGDSSSRLTGSVAFTESGPELDLVPSLVISLAVFPQKVTATVVLGGESEIFIDEADFLQPRRFVSQKKNGATLECDGTPSTPPTKCFYTNASGIKIEFNVPTDALFGITPVSVKYPDGEIIRFKNYTSSVPIGTFIGAPPFNGFVGIESNKGMTIGTNGATFLTRFIWNSVFTINRAVENCTASANTTSCNFSTPVAALINNATDRTVTDQAGGIWRWSVNAQNRMSALRRPGSPNADSIAILYNSDGKVSSVTNQNGTSTYSYVVDGPAPTQGTTARTIVTNAQGTQTAYEYKIGTGRVTSIKDGLNRIARSTYDANGRLMTQTQPEGNSVSYTYDDRGNVLLTVLTPKLGSALPPIVTSATYLTNCTSLVTCNKPSATRDAKGNQTDYAYDSVTGLPTTVTAPAAIAGGIRPTTRYIYTQKQAFLKDGTGNIIATGEPISLLSETSTCQTLANCAGTSDEVKTRIDYGPQVSGTANNLYPVSVSVGSGNGAITATTLSSYDAVGNVVAVDGPLAGSADTTTVRYDVARRVVGSISPDPDAAGSLKRRAQRISYNADGQVTLTEIGTVNGTSDADWAGFVSLQQSSSVYDANARLSRESVTASGTTYSVVQYSYNALGRLDCTAQRLNPAVWGSLPASACTAQTAGTSGADRISKTVYDVANRVTQVQTAFGTAGQENIAQTYNSNDTQATLTDGKGNKTTFIYDAFDRPMETHYPLPNTPGQSSNTDYEGVERDANGNITAKRLRAGHIVRYSYDNLNRLTLKDIPNLVFYDFDISNQYDLLGRLTRTEDSSGHYAAITYDGLGRQVSETGNFSTRFFNYDLAGRRTLLTYGDGFYVTYDYLVTGEALAIRENGGAALGTYAYDDLGRRTSLTRGNGTVTSYAYDPASRLTSLVQDFAGTEQDVTSSFTYNAASQIGSRTRSNDLYAWNGATAVNRPYTSNGLNQHTTSGSTALGYDGNGNLTSAGSDAYSYTLENRLASGPNSALFTYDPFGRLTYQITGPSLNVWQHDGDKLIREQDTAGNTFRRHVHGPGSDEPLLTYEGAGTTDKRYLHGDERGSIIALSSASGQVTQINAYDDYGIPQGKNAAGAVITNGTGLATASFGRFGYTGQAWLPEIGLSYYKARMYSPPLGRFMQADPIGYGGGSNLYAYVRNDPINGVDPSGLLTLPNGTGIDENDGQSGTGGDLIIVTAQIGGGGFSGGLSITSPVQRIDLSSANITPQGKRPTAAGRMSDEDAEDAEEADLEKCRSLGGGSAAARCYESAALRDGQRRAGKPLSDLITRSDIKVPDPKPKFNGPDDGALAGAAAIILSIGAAALYFILTTI